MGFIGTETQLFDEFKFARSEANTIAANDNDYMTSIPGIFAAGDARRGQSLVVWAIAEGRGAAAAIDKFLTAVKEAFPSPAHSEQTLTVSRHKPLP